MQVEETPSPSLLSGDDVLQAMKAPDDEHNSKYGDRLYVLGCLKSPLTFHSQQQRAFNLIWALRETGRIGPDKELVVIGAGLGGVTAAAAALLCGAKVTLLERNSQVLQLQNKNTSRFIHPNLYDWPQNAGNLKHETDLPCLNWTADYAGQVIEQVQRQWLEIEHEVNKASRGGRDGAQHSGARLRVICNCEVTGISTGPDSRNRSRIHVRTNIDADIAERRTPHDSDYDCAILAVGFGIETSLGDKVPGNSYWMMDALEQVRPDRPRPNKVLVLGAGDGGLTDVLRLRIENFDHKTLHESLTAAVSADVLNRLFDLDEEVVKIENDHERQQALYQRYVAELKYGLAVDVSKLCFRLRSDTYVILRSSGKHPYDVSASILNRVAVFILMEILHDPSLHYVCEPIGPEQVSRSRWFEVQFGQRKAEFHDIVVRLGTEKAVAKFFPNARIQRAFDPTRFFSYKDSFSQEWKPLGRDLGAKPDQRLPALPDLIGRERDIANVLHLIQNQQPRILTMTGPAGVGKSALALVVADRLRKTFSNIVYIDLRSIEFTDQFDSDITSQRKLVAEKICERLGLPSAPGQLVVDTVGAAIRYKKTLIVLDGFDRLIRARELLSDFLDRSSRLHFLLTSRTALGFANGEEWVFRVVELDHPPHDGTAPFVRNTGATTRARKGDRTQPKKPAESSAVELFLHRAELADAAVEQNPENMILVRKICHRLGGVPLALGLIAVQLKRHGLAKVLERLNELQSIAPEKKALQFSYSKLSGPEQAVLNALSIFPAGCRSEQAARVCRGIAPDKDLAAILDALVRAQLLERAEDFDGAPRFRMLQAIRSFAYEKLQASKSLQRVREHFSEGYVLLAEEIEPKLTSGERDRGRWLDRLRVEDENFRAVLSQSNGAPKERPLRLAGALFWFWNFMSRLEEGLAWLDRVVGDCSPASDPRARSKAYYARGAFHMLQGDQVKSGREDAAESLHLSDSILQENPKDIRQQRIKALTLIIQGMLYFEENPAIEGHDALNDFRTSRDIMREIKDEWGEALATLDLARAEGTAVNWSSGSPPASQIEEARESFASALAKWRALGDRWGIALTLTEWGRFEGHIPERSRFAQQTLQQALQMQRERHDFWGEANTLLRLAEAFANSKEPNDLNDAATQFRDALKLNLDVGRREVMCECAIGWAKLNLKRGDPRKAACLFGAAETLLDQNSPNSKKIHKSIDREFAGISHDVAPPDSLMEWRHEGAEIGRNKERWMELLR